MVLNVLGLGFALLSGGSVSCKPYSGRFAPLVVNRLAKNWMTSPLN